MSFNIYAPASKTQTAGKRNAPDSLAGEQRGFKRVKLEQKETRDCDGDASTALVVRQHQAPPQVTVGARFSMFDTCDEQQVTPVKSKEKEAQKDKTDDVLDVGTLLRLDDNGSSSSATSSSSSSSSQSTTLALLASPLGGPLVPTAENMKIRMLSGVERTLLHPDVKMLVPMEYLKERLHNPLCELPLGATLAQRMAERWLTMTPSGAWKVVEPNSEGKWIHSKSQPLFLSSSFRLSPSMADSVREQLSASALDKLDTAKDPLTVIRDLARFTDTKLTAALDVIRSTTGQSGGGEQLANRRLVLNSAISALKRIVILGKQALVELNAYD